MWQLVYINWFNIFGLLTTIVAYKWSTKWYLEDLLHSWPNFYPGLRCSFKLQVNWVFMSNGQPSNFIYYNFNLFFQNIWFCFSLKIWSFAWYLEGSFTLLTKFLLWVKVFFQVASLWNVRRSNLFIKVLTCFFFKVPYFRQ